MDTLESVIYSCVDEMSPSLSARPQKLPDTPLLGPASIFDSIDFVTFIIAVEERVEAATGERIHLLSDTALSATRSPFRTLGTLANHVDDLLRSASRE